MLTNVIRYQPRASAIPPVRRSKTFFLISGTTIGLVINSLEYLAPHKDNVKLVQYKLSSEHCSIYYTVQPP